MKLNKLILITILLATFSLAVASLTLEELVASYNFDFYDGTINITNTTGIAKDINNDGKNDTILFTLITDATNSTNYTFIVSLFDKNTTISNTTSKFVSSSDSNVNISLRTSLLSGTVFNYSVIVYNTTDSLVFKREKIPLTILNYAQLLGITSITDSAVNTSSFIKITLSVNANESLGNVNVTVFMDYSNKSISSTSLYNMAAGSNTLNIYFDNETIKSTHYSGTYLIDNVAIGDLLIDTNHTTSSYNYEDFAKTSYFYNYSDSALDLQNDNITEYFDLNFTVNIKDIGVHTIEYSLSDLFNNFVLNYTNATNFTTTGLQVFRSRINATVIHYAKVDGPYLIQYANLSKNNKQVDFVFEPYITNAYSYLGFAAPPLPDFILDLNVSFTAARDATLQINVTNKGNAPAFNVFVDVFDNESYSNTSLIPNINTSQSFIYQINATNISSKIVAIADFDDFIEELNETNNIDTYGITNQNEPTTPSEIFCNTNLCITNETFFNQFDIMCNGSIDPENDNITYFVDAFYNHSTNVSSGYINTFSNGLAEENLSFTGDENITRYITLPKNITVNFAQVVLKSNVTYESGNMQLKTPDTELLEDTFTNGANADGNSKINTNYGSLTELFVSNQTKEDPNVGETWTWLVFNITNLQESANITSAFIAGYERENRKFPPSRLKLYYSSNVTWKEENLVYSNKPSLGFLVNVTVDRDIGGAGSLGWVFADVVKALNAALGNDSNKVSVVWVAEGSAGNQAEGNYMIFWSKEYSIDTSKRIYMNISYEINNTIFNPSLNIGADETNEWLLAGTFDSNNSPQFTADLSREINNYLFDCTPDQYGNCSVPVVFHSDNRGNLTYYDINITYQSNQHYWERVGNHTKDKNVSWNFINVSAQDGVMVRCSASDINGSQLFSDYLQPRMNMTLNINLTFPPTPTFNIANLSVTNSSGKNFIFEFLGLNIEIYKIANLSWSLNTSDNLINSTQLFNFTGSESIFFFIENNYTQSGNKTVKAIIFNSTISDSKTISTVVP